jgi:hypothetical protein
MNTLLYKIKSRILKNINEYFIRFGIINNYIMYFLSRM